MSRAIAVAVLLLTFHARAQDAGVTRCLTLAPKEGNPRNSEGSFVTLKDGRILFVYTHFTGGAGDNAAAHLAGRFSSDGGRTWTAEDVVVVPREGGMNVMSVSLLRLGDGRIGLWYLVKNSLEDCRAWMRVSTDEAKTWGEARPCMPERGYFVVNNDRVAQLKGGRILVPAARHDWGKDKELKGSHRGVAVCFYSDDGGATWKQSKSALEAPGKSKSGLQEPLVVELKDGRVMMLCRTDLGCQYRSYSGDGGVTWSAAEGTEIASPLSPASVERIPGSGDLMMVWNDHRNVGAEYMGKRTPLCVAVSKDEGRTWGKSKVIEGDPGGWFCYTAIHFAQDRVLLGYCAGEGKGNRLGTTAVSSFAIEWLYP